MDKDEVNDKKEAKSSSGFIKQASILAISGIIVRIIGFLYRSPLYRVIGAEGNGYYSTAYNIYVIILLVASYSIPAAISKVMAQKIAIGEYKNAKRIFRCSFVYVVVVGFLASLFAFFAAPYLLNDANSVVVLKFFAPAIFFSGLLGVIRGYFQARKDMTKTSISQIIEQIINATFSIGVAYFLMDNLRKKLVDTRSASAQTKISVNGAIGSAIGTGMGVVIALIFMIIVYIKKSKKEKQLTKEDKSVVESYSKIFWMIFSTITPMLLSTFIYNINVSLNQNIFLSNMKKLYDISKAELSSYYGFFANTTTLTNIPLAIASATGATLIPNIATSYAQKNNIQTKKQVNIALKVVMLIAIPSAVGLSVLSYEIIGCMYGAEGHVETARILMCMGVSIICYCISTLTNAVLQGIGKVNIPVRNALISLFPQTVALYLFIRFSSKSIGVFGLVLATSVYALGICILNAFSVKKYLGYKQEVVNIYIKPLLASGIMAMVVLPLKLVLNYLDINIYIVLVVCMICAIIVYFIVINRLKIVDDDILKSVPKIERVLKRLRLIKNND